MTKFLTATAALALLPSAVWAESNDIIVTATRAEQSSSQIGQAITVIDAKTLETRQTVALVDILSTTPGVTYARNGGIGSTTSLFIRGASSEHTLVVIDGVRVNDPSTPGGSYDFGNLLAGDVSRVEILRGADSVPWGSAAIGGVVNITTFAPTAHLRGTVSAEGGSFGTSNLNGHVSDTFGPVALSLGGGWLHTSGISAFDKNEGGKEADGFDQHYFNGRAEVKLANNISLDFRGRYARGNVQIDGSPAPFFVTADTAQYGITRELNGYAGIRAAFFDDRFKNRLGYTVTDINRKSFNPAKATPLTGNNTGRVARIEYQGEFTVIDPVRLVFGAEHEKSEYLDAKSGAVYRTGLDSLYGQIVATPLTPLTITAGVRYDHHQVYRGHTTFSANAALRVTHTTTVRASYAEGFKAPTLYQINGDAFTNPNPNLKPETATSYDIGIEQTALDGAIRAQVTYFKRNTNNLIGYVSGSFPTYVGIYNNINRAKAEGFEFSLALNPTKNLNVTAQYTHIKSVDATAVTEVRLTRRPNDTASVSIDWDAGRVKLGGTIQMTGDSTDIDFDSPAYPSPTVTLQSYVLVGLRVSVPITKQVELYGRVDNLFDEQYQVVRHYGTLGRAAYAGIRLKI